MLGSRDVITFVATTDAAKARQFYEAAHGLRFVSDDRFAVIFDANGTTLRVTKVRSFEAAEHTVLGWQVTDIDDAARDLSSRGVVFERYDGFNQDELGIWNAPDGFRIVWFKDPDGNVLSLTQP